MAWPPERRSISSITLLRLDLRRGNGGEPEDALPATAGSAATRPGGRRRWLSAMAGLVSARNLFSFSKNAPGVADDGQVRDAVLADFGRIDIDVDHLGVRSESGEAAGDAVVEADAEGDQEIACGSGPCWRRSCRACRAC